MSQNPVFDRNLYLSSIFDNEIIYYETALPLEGEEIELLFPIKEVLSVRNYGLNIEYKKGIDYIVKDKKLLVLPTGKIRITPFDEYYCKTPAQEPIKVVKDRCKYNFKDDRYMMFGEGHFMSDRQIAISYRREGKWDLFRQKEQREKLHNFFNKLINKEKTSIVFYGDSITVGCNSSGTVYGGNVPPYAESWSTMVYEYLKEKYQCDIKYFNTAVGGMNTKWGLDNYKERVLKHNPDLVFIAFGMNDGSLDKNEHIKMIKQIIDGIKKHNPKCSIILISTSVANIESNWFLSQHTYIEEYLKLNLNDVAIVDMTNMHLDLLKRKRFKDMSGNNVNHPNDFLVRIYAQSILKVMGEYNG